MRITDRLQDAIIRLPDLCVAAMPLNLCCMPLWCCSELEGAEATLLSASGMCAATTMLLALVPEGGHIVTTTDCYRRTRQFIQTMLPKMGITVRFRYLQPQSYSETLQ